MSSSDFQDRHAGGQAAPFSEREFYLAEFRGRTLAFALPARGEVPLSLLGPVVVALESNRTRVLLISRDDALLQELAQGRVLRADDPRWVGQLWRAMREGAPVAIAVRADEELSALSRRVALRLGLAKLVWMDGAGPLMDAAGERISWLDMAGIEALLAGEQAAALDPERRRWIEEVGIMLGAGLPAVNLCSPEGLADDLFTFEGSGTFFARDRYLDVRRLALDDLDAAHDLILRGVGEGYLVERTPEQLEEVLANAFGVFVERRYLAGVGALLPWPGPEPAGEIGSLYTLTRFLGEGVGGHLVSFALECAAQAGFGYVFACTTSERVQRFFERHGFRCVEADEIPAAKWRGYPAERRSRVRCLRRDLSSDGGSDPRAGEDAHFGHE